MPIRVPKYRFHKASGQALVEIRGKHIYLGKYDSPESHELYKQLIAQHFSDNPVLADASTEKSIKVKALVLKYFRFAKGYYLKNGQPTDEITSLRIILRRLRKMYGSTQAKDFGPKAFKTVRESLIQKGLSRKYINDSMNRIRRMFKWGVAEELIPPSVHQALIAVPGLKKGRTTAKESEKVLPVADDIIEATLPFLGDVVTDMVRLQRYTGMRPAEICIIRPCDIDRTNKIWLYRPESHKTQHHGHERIVLIGPKAQGVLLPYLVRDPQSYCFRPCDSEAKRRALAHANRNTPISYGNTIGTNRKSSPKVTIGESYNTNSYRRAIHRACDKAFKHPELSGIKPADLNTMQKKELRIWRSNHRWSPNQLRHTAATEIRREFGLEAAQVILGHSEADVTQVYAERDLAKGFEVAHRIG